MLIGRGREWIPTRLHHPALHTGLGWPAAHRVIRDNPTRRLLVFSDRARGRWGVRFGRAHKEVTAQALLCPNDDEDTVAGAAAVVVAKGPPYSP